MVIIFVELEQAIINYENWLWWCDYDYNDDELWQLYDAISDLS
jgi:hypothetical protein